VDRPTIAAEVAGAYGVASGHAPPDALRLECEIGCHAELGLHVRVWPRTIGARIVPGIGFAPLDPLLADRLLEAAGLSPGNGVPMADRLAAGDVLTRLTQLAMDHPSIAQVSATLLVAGGVARLGFAPRIALASPLPPRQRLALAPYPVEHERAVALAGGASVQVRAIRPTDEDAVIRLLESIDTESIRLRFFSYVRHFSHAMAARMTQIDYDRELGLIAFTADAAPQAVGLATLISDPDGTEAEFAILVHQGIAREGLGRRLMEQMIEHARAIGLRRVFGDVLQENSGMLGLAARLGFRSTRHPDEPGCLRVELDLPGREPPAPTCVSAGAGAAHHGRVQVPVPPSRT
jgi:GNAT superfamily N-acetyltransferase